MARQLKSTYELLSLGGLEAFEGFAHCIENERGTAAAGDRHFGYRHDVAGFHGLSEEAVGEDVAELVRIGRRLSGRVFRFFRRAGAEEKDRAFVFDGVRKQGGDVDAYRRLFLWHGACVWQWKSVSVGRV